MGRILNIASAAKIDYQIKATLKATTQPASSIALEAAKKVVKAYTDKQFRIGKPIFLSAIYASLHQSGIEQVTIIKPIADIDIDNSQFANCTNIAVTMVVYT